MLYLASSFLFALFASFISSAASVSYSQTDSFVGSQFNNGFSYEAIADPTNGRVYVYLGSTVSTCPSHTPPSI